jgi:hypothetical protein
LERVDGKKGKWNGDDVVDGDYNEKLTSLGTDRACFGLHES